MRVDVWNGDKSIYLGKGHYDEDVTVYFFKKDGGISSNTNAEEKPIGVPEEDITEVEANPKIVLDNGRTVYGCQVWWSPCEDDFTLYADYAYSGNLA